MRRQVDAAEGPTIGKISRYQEHYVPEVQKYDNM